MADPRRDETPDETEKTLDERLERLEQEMAEKVDKSRREVEGSDLFLSPPHPGPIPEVLRRPVQRPTPTESKAGGLAGLGAAWGVAIDFLVTIGAGIAIGYGIDRWQGTRPWGVLIGMAVGFAGALVRIIRYTQKIEREEAAARARKRQG